MDSLLAKLQNPGGGNVPTYILLSSLTPEGSQTLHKNPWRLDTVNKEIPQCIGEVVTRFVGVGGYDFVTIVDAPDNESVALFVDLSSRATVRITTPPAISVAELTARLKSPGRGC